MNIKDELVFSTKWGGKLVGELFCHFEDNKPKYFVCSPADSLDKIKISLLEEIAFGNNIFNKLQARKLYVDLLKIGVKDDGEETD